VVVVAVAVKVVVAVGVVVKDVVAVGVVVKDVVAVKVVVAVGIVVKVGVVVAVKVVVEVAVSVAGAVGVGSTQFNGGITMKKHEMLAVSDDASRDMNLWLYEEGAWVAIVMADPIYYGRLMAITPTHYFLADASWVADTGRAHAFVADPSSASEVEYLGEIAIERPAVAVYRVRKGGKLRTK